MLTYFYLACREQKYAIILTTYKDDSFTENVYLQYMHRVWRSCLRFPPFSLAANHADERNLKVVTRHLSVTIKLKMMLFFSFAHSLNVTTEDTFNWPMKLLLSEARCVCWSQIEYIIQNLPPDVTPDVVSEPI